jgi:adenylate cyclase
MKIRWPVKISIRLSILSIVLVLLLGISALIIGINYFVLNSVLIAAASDSLNYAGGKVSEQISSYLRPLRKDNFIDAYMPKSTAIKLGYSADLIRFLYNLVSDEKNISGATFGDTAGNLYWLNRIANGNYLEQTTLHGNKTIEKIFDSQGKLLSTKDLPFARIDPRLRPWYQQAKLKQKDIWITYKFLPLNVQDAQLGITAAFPCYDLNGKFLGVFGIDMLIATISKYIHDLKVTPNSVVFLVNDVGNAITDSMDKDALKNEKLPNINGQLLKKSFVLYQKTHKPLFIYSINNKKYICSYEKIANTPIENSWFVSIITPVADITAPLRKSIFIALMLTSIVIIIGIILASVFSTSLSRPIKRLAQEANLICQLRLAEVKDEVSGIIEIAEMQESFVKMKNALASFQRYMPVILVKKLIVGNKIATVGGETKELTIIFTDIKNFTQLSERINEQELMQYLSRYFQAITKVIIEMNGTVDKYMGDGLMAFWGAPVDDTEHARHACQAVLQIQASLKQLNEEFREENKPMVATRIGINTGKVIVGNVGSDERLNYTSLGDPVNLASRLEGLNKIYGTWMIVSEFTYNKVKDNFKFRLLDKVAVKGKQQGIYIYELLEDAAVAPYLNLEQYNQEFFSAFSCYESSDWQAAINLFNNLDKKYPEDLLIKIFIKRCLVFNANPPANWNGIWVMTEK